MNDLRILRDRQSRLETWLDLVGANTDSFGSAAMCVVTTTVTAYPAGGGGLYYACNPEQITGVETEGSVAIFVPNTTTIVYACNIGTTTPPVGTKLVVHSVGGRWVFRFDG